MKSNLEIVIEHLQREVDHLMSSMNACAHEWDFDGTKSFRGPLLYTKRKLDILNSLQNPKYDDILKKKQRINNIKNSLNGKFFDNGIYDEETRIEMEMKVKTELRYQLKTLEAELTIQTESEYSATIDSDEILNCLELLFQRKIEQIQFDIIPNVVSLIMNRLGHMIQTRIKIETNSELNEHINYYSRPMLSKLGFDKNSLIMTIKDYRDTNAQEILQTISQIVYELYSQYGNKQMNITVK